MFDHLGFEVRNLAKSRKFYEAVLAPLGVKVISDLKEYGTVGFGVDRPQFWLGAGQPSTGEDEFHLCFAAKSRAAVRSFYETAIKAGGRDNGKPGLRPEYHEHYYGAFILDFDGYNIEACCHKPE